VGEKAFGVMGTQMIGKPMQESRMMEALGPHTTDCPVVAEQDRQSRPSARAVGLEKCGV